MDIKWFMIGLMFIFGAGFAGQAASDYYKGQCRVEMIKAGKPAAEIAAVCR